MPRLVNSLPKYRRHRGSNQAVVGLNGRDYYLGPYGTRTSKLEYDRLVAEWLASGRSMAFGVSPASLSVAELLVGYLTHAQSYYGDGKKGEYANMRRALRPVKELYSKTAAADFGPTQLKTVRQRFIDAGHSRKFINHNIQRIIRVFRWGVSEGNIRPEIPQALAMVAGLRKGHTSASESRPVRPAKDELVDATIPCLPPVVQAMVELQRITGMRPGELVIVRPCDIDRSGDVWEYRPETHKNSNREQDRIVYFGPRCQEILRPYLLRAADSYCFSPAESESRRRAERSEARKTPLSCGNTVGSRRVQKPKRTAGGRYTTESYLYAVRRACDRANPVPDAIQDEPLAVAKWRSEHRWSPNQLRHALATRVRREFDIDAAKTLLGHSQLSTTGIYAEQDRRRAVEVAKLIG